MSARKALALKIAQWTAAIVLTAIVLFALSAWIGSSIPRNSNWTQADPAREVTVPIMVGTNGIHTEIAMPVKTPIKDWSAAFPVTDVVLSHRPYTHVAVSWGERAFFLETPSWYDVNPLVVLNAMTGGDGVLHVAHYVRPAPSHDYRIVHLRVKEYARLVDAIESQFIPAAKRETLPGYDGHDVFYTARGTYHLGNTCNQWTSDRLAAAGVETGRWTPMSGGVMKWVADATDD